MNYTERKRRLQSVLVRAEFAAAFAGSGLDEIDWKTQMVRELSTLMAPNDDEDASRQATELHCLLDLLAYERDQATLYGEPDKFIAHATLDGKGTVSVEEARAHPAAYKEAMSRRL